MADYLLSDDWDFVAGMFGGDAVVQDYYGQVEMSAMRFKFGTSTYSTMTRLMSTLCMPT
ncbi:MAG: hypothetical protein R3C05_22365 [Pirellulaceae bacterium]